MQEDIKQILSVFLAQVEENDHTTSHYPSSYSGLTLKVGFGIGLSTKIPWVAFLGGGQTPQKGIFPVFYFFKERRKLILAYGISEKEKPNLYWQINPDRETITKYFKKFGITPHKFGLSYVYQVYDSENLDLNKIELDLDTLIDRYKRVLK